MSFMALCYLVVLIILVCAVLYFFGKAVFG